jgi:phosphate transport system substrate-binding protein
MRSFGHRRLVLSAVLAFALVPTTLAAAKVEGASKLSGSITADGSSTVGPYTTSAAELFRRANPAVRITVAISGTGGGFQRFCNGEIDLANASRPIKASEMEACQKNNVKWSAFAVANDGIALVVNKQNTWANCLTVAQARRIWEPGSKVDNWSQIDPRFPNQKLKLFGPAPSTSSPRRSTEGHVPADLITPRLKTTT